MPIRTGQLQHPLGGHGGINRALRRGEGRAHPVSGVLEQEAPMRLNRPAQHLIVGGQRRSHLIGVRFPPTGRSLNIGEQKGHHTRRSSRRHGIASAHFICPAKPSDVAIAR